MLGLFMFAQFGTAQNSHSYESLWNQVEKLEETALTKSALKLVETISQRAKKEGNSNQVIKALLYKSKFALTLEENAQLNIINDFKRELEKAQTPVKNILHSYLAGLYRQYFQQNRYTFYQRTTTEKKVDSVDFRTWDLATIFKEIDLNYRASLEQPEKLQKRSVTDFDLILHEQENSKVYRPTLFDLLAHAALDFYMTSENSIDTPADSFEIDNQDILCEAYSFSFMDFNSLETGSLQSRALELYRQLVRFHFGNPDLNPLVLVDLERLRFTHNNAVFGNKDALYVDVLTDSAEGLRSSPLSGLYLYEIALHYQQIGSTYSPKASLDTQWKLKESIAICDKVIATFPNSLAADKCKGLKAQIQAPSLQLTSEQHIATATPSRLLVNYKNYEELKLTVHKINPKQIAALEKLYPQAKKKSFLENLPVATTWTASLKTEKDYQNHSTEISVPALQNGFYAIVAQPTVGDDNTFSYTMLQVTNMALVTSQTNTHQYFQVINRKNGNPISHVKATVNYRINYDGPMKRASFVTDNNGSFSIKKDKNTWNNVTISLEKEEEIAVFKEYYINQSYPQNSESLSNSCFLFTDRSIYRPGQPLYFKGIVIENDRSNSKPAPEELITVGLYDVNNTKISEQDLKTNEFGSFSGEFILPSSGLNGDYHLEAYGLSGLIDTDLYFSVEEYKRPKFETSFEPVMETYQVNDSIKITGKASAYAGSTISDATVVYRVKRVVDFPTWYYWSRPYYNATAQEIAYGETTTDASGGYEIIFKALPDKSIDKESLPTFNYEITADVTDINGETRSTSIRVSVGYHALNVNLILPETIDKQDKNAAFRISSTNLNGAFVPASGNVKLYKLIAPDRVLRPRTWAAPDYPGFTEERFKALYPHEAYRNEDDPKHWEKGSMVWQSNFDTQTSTELKLGNLSKWDSGYYRMELQSKDKFGQPVKDFAFFTLTADDEKRPADNSLLQIKLDKDEYSIGEKANITFLSNAKDLTLTVTVEKNQTIVDSLIIKLNNNSKTISLPINEGDLGGYAVNYSYAFQNYYQSKTVNIRVPYPNDELQIETLTFRDKIEPGTDETWSFKIKGAKGDQVSAELLANMYDASLDQFKGHYWSFNPLSRPTYYSVIRPNAYTSFAKSSFNTYQDYKGYSYTPLNFDSLDWFGLHFGYEGMFREQRMGKLASAAATASFEMMEDGASLDEVVMTGAAVSTENEADINEPQDTGSGTPTDLIAVPIRKNLQENAFFFPQLRTDGEGNVTFSFKTPEALTRWNLQLLAHTKTLESSIKNLSTVTQKELMVLPNTPRFLREGDEIVISTKISNLSKKQLAGTAALLVSNAMTGMDISENLLDTTATDKEFKVDSLGNTEVSWRLKIPNGLQSVQYKIIAKAGDYSDGEQNLLPVLTNRMLVTETLPMWVRGKETKTFTLNKLKNVSSPTLRQHQLTLEITSNPAWYAIQALPYLMEYPYECNEQTFAKYYANSLATHIATSNPRIKEVFEQWANATDLVSNLEKNQDLKALLIQETPWLRDAQSETEQKQRIGLLFNLNKMQNEQIQTLSKLVQNQKTSGAWPWFNGGPDNRYITQHIISGLGHLRHLGVTASLPSNQSVMIDNALSYLENEFIDEYEQMKKSSSNINDDHLSANQIQYLYLKKFFREFEGSKKANEIAAYYLGQAQKYWMNKGLSTQGTLALIVHRTGDEATANKILQSLEENSINSIELGMYWKKNTNSWNWYDAPIETQALLIEAFSEIRPRISQRSTTLKFGF